jgi:hypothetical protein
MEIIDGSHDIVVDGLESYENGGAGFSIHAHNFGSGMPRNITVKNCKFHNNGMYGVNIFKDHPGDEVDLNIRFENCQMQQTTNADKDRFGFGLYIAQNGKFTNFVSGVTFVGCAFTANDSFAARVRGDNLTFQQCLFTDGWMIRAEDCRQFTLHNCTLYQPAGGKFAPLQVLGKRTDGIDVRNCIIVNETPTELITIAVPTNVMIDYNLYQPLGDATKTRWMWTGKAHTFADWQTLSGQDAHSPAPADPAFVNKASRDFSLQAASPALNVGVNLGLPYTGSAPDLGWVEYSG